MAIPDIIDNRTDESSLKTVIKKLIKYSRKAWIASGFFYLSGFDLIADDLDSIQSFKLVIGDETDYQTKIEIQKGYSLKKRLIKDINSIKYDDINQQHKIIAFHDFIADPSKNCEIRIYTRQKFHSKAYLFDYNNRDEDYSKIGIIGSSNFTRSGLMNNTELNTTLLHEATTNQLLNWFNIIWEESEFFKEDLLKIIKNSAIYRRSFDPNYLPPFELFKKIIFHYLNKQIATPHGILAEFQNIGVENAEIKIRNYKGVLICDSVGLGKSFIGAALIKRFLSRCQKILCILPANIILQWKELLKKEFNMNFDSIRFISHTKFSMLDSDQVAKKFNNIDVLLIDEAHKFRNRGTNIKRSVNIEKLKGKIFILLTATPLNNSIMDLKNLIFIFTTPNRLRTKNLNPDSFDQYQKLIVKERKSNDLTIIEKQEKAKLLKQISEILEQVMLLRTRTVIKKRYPNLKINNKRIKFSNPKINKIEYDIGKDLSKVIDLEDFVQNIIEKLNLPHIFISSGANGETLGALFRILLLKRLESSIYSFYLSLKNLVEAELKLKEELENFSYFEVKKTRKTNHTLNFDTLNDDIDLAQLIPDLITKGELDNDKYDEAIIKKRYFEMIAEDIGIINQILEDLNNLLNNSDNILSFKDNKVDTLFNIIKNHENEKILIFSQYRATVEYLFYRIAKKYNKISVEKILGGSTEKESIATRFSPESNDAIVKDHNVLKIDQLGNPIEIFGTEIQILISTDTLSEGVNLQDCDIIINYDLPWNPTRIIQRVGRIDRIGSNNQKTVYNLKADDSVELLLRLMEKLENKVKDISSIIGREYGILSEDENPNIKTIGQKIKDLQQSDSIDDYEKIAMNQFFKELEFSENDDSELVLEIRSELKKLNLTHNDFEAYSLSPGGYCLIQDNLHIQKKRKFPFIYFKIKDTNQGESIKHILLKKRGDGEIIKISPLDVFVNIDTEGIYYKEYSEKNRLTQDLKEIEIEFQNTYFTPIKSQYKVSSKGPRKFFKIQQEIISRLREIKKSQILEDLPLKSKLLGFLKLYSKSPFNLSDAKELKKKFKGKSVKQTKNYELLQILEKFNKSTIQNTPDYTDDISLVKDIKYEKILWGAFI